MSTKATYSVHWSWGHETNGLTFAQAYEEVKRRIARGDLPIKVFNLDNVDLDFDGLTEDEREDIEHVSGQDWVECGACGAFYAREDGRGEACIDCTAKDNPPEPDDDWKRKFDR
jgi:hypothetical protein